MNSLMTDSGIFKKLEILTDAAKYDVACTSSGVDRGGRNGSMGNAVAGGICHCFAGDGRCISLLKILFTNECVYDCKYCVNRISNDVPRASFTPKEIAELTIAFYRRNYIEGLFLSSGIHKSPDFTMEQIYEALYLLRNHYHFNGYIHVKAIPGADPVLIEKVGWLADRMSTNLELPTAKGLEALAPQKSRKKLLTPMRQIQLGRHQDMDYHGIPLDRRMVAPVVPALEPMENKMKISQSRQDSPLLTDGESLVLNGSDIDDVTTSLMTAKATSLDDLRRTNSHFVPAGQSTQMIIGATEETDYEIVKVAEALYNNFDLKRVFYSAFINTTNDPLLPMTNDGPPLLREHRLYQADFLLRFYHFQADEIISADHPDLDVHLDPKCNWAVNHLEFFPVEVRLATYQTLLRVPGIGPKSAKRIISARRQGTIRPEDLKKMGVVLKRAIYFITCGGHPLIPLKMNQNFILTNLLGLRERLPAHITGEPLYQQMSLLDITGVNYS